MRSGERESERESERERESLLGTTNIQGSRASPAHSLRITIRISKGLQGRADVERGGLVSASTRKGRRRFSLFVLHIYTHSAVTLSHAAVQTQTSGEFLDLGEKRRRRAIKEEGGKGNESCIV
jgi:hypothetical protein